MKLEDLKSIVVANFVDDRQNFKTTWLSEMPGVAGTLNTFPALLFNLKSLLKHGVEKQNVKQDIFKLLSDSVGYYWIESDGQPALIVEVKIQPDAIIVYLLGKKSDVFGKSPYASDLYEAILNDSGKSILMSDEYLTDNSFDVWARLLKNGKTISVYDAKTADLQKIDSVEALKSFYHSSGNRFRFILSDSALKESAIRADFNRFQFRRDNSIN